MITSNKIYNITNGKKSTDLGDSEESLKQEIENMKIALQGERILRQTLEEEKKIREKELEKDRKDREERKEALNTAIRLMKKEEEQKIKYEQEAKKAQKIKESLEQQLALIEKDQKTQQGGDKNKKPSFFNFFKKR